ncbi:MAG: hypothetical protein CL452_03960 [Acidimicrobiaceae bacterium]|mgnify:FL=1|nr:hypothetical protein [Acidimicrobiaceae bacterium]MBD26885.1 hypothetical protein [Acidimicrobiaceae bacterium]CAI8301990.1 MAG: Uncharacterised protein [Acidimicrobiaceae bacterium]
MNRDKNDWEELSRRAAFASHRLIGWIYWDPRAIANYEALGVPDGFGYYVSTRAATLGKAGNKAVSASFYSIHPDFIKASLDNCREHTTFEKAAGARDAAVAPGLQQLTPEICEPLATMSPALWNAAEKLPLSGRALFASLLDWPRHEDPLTSAWLAVNAIREWRGDTHWAIMTSENIDGTMAGILDNAKHNYDDQWLPRSRGADDEAISFAFKKLAERGLANGEEVTTKGLEFREELERKLNNMASAAWRNLGIDQTIQFLELIEPVGSRYMDHIDRTAGSKWMPAGREVRS